MGKAFDVSANIGFDGSTYFCKRCGKAGYGKATQVRGHLAMCPGTLMRKGVEPTTACNHLQPLATEYNGGLSGGQPVVVAAVVDPVANPPVGGYEQLASQVATMAGEFTTMAGEVATMRNHYNHMMGQVNQPQYQPVGQDFFSQYKGIIIVGAIIFFALMLSERSGNCQGASDGKSTSANNIGTKALTKLVDTGITKGIASLFK
jgi:hypothetical protein